MRRLFFAGLLLILAQSACSTSATATPAPTSAATAAPAPTAVSINPTQEAATLEPQPSATAPSQTEQAPGNSLQSQFEEIDKSLSQSMKSSIAYNVPTSMKLDDSATIQLLLNPVETPAQLGNQVTEAGQVVTATIAITPFMKAELLSVDPNAFAIQPMLDDPVQPIGTSTVTQWEWTVTAHKAGQQKLTLVISRLVKAQGQDYWTIIETYKSDVNVQVTMTQWLASLDWKWILGIIVTALVIPGFWRWNDERKKKVKKKG